MALTDTVLKALKPTEKPTKHSDGGGLHVLVSPKGSKLWRLSYRFDGKQQTLALGSYPAVTLADARRERENVKALLAKGINPSQHAKLQRIAKRSSNAVTFKAVDPTKLKNSATANIAGSVAEIGLKLDEDTVRKFLNEAKVLLQDKAD